MDLQVVICGPMRHILPHMRYGVLSLGPYSYTNISRSIILGTTIQDGYSGGFSNNISDNICIQSMYSTARDVIDLGHYIPMGTADKKRMQGGGRE